MGEEVDLQHVARWALSGQGYQLLAFPDPTIQYSKCCKNGENLFTQQTKRNNDLCHMIFKVSFLEKAE